MEKNVAFIFIGTGKYVDFFEDYYDSVMDTFMPDVPKTIFAFTDRTDHELFNQEGVKTYEIKHQDWPFITLKRFEFIAQAEEELKEFSDIIFMDADMYVARDIGQEFLDSYSKLFGVHHPGQFIYGDVCEFEGNPESTAFVSEDKRGKYRQGCFWGGRNPYILDMILTLKDNVRKDLENGIIAAWHDESHLNGYFCNYENEVTTLHSGYAHPQNWNMPVEKVIVHLDKNMEEYPRFRSGDVENDD